MLLENFSNSRVARLYVMDYGLFQVHSNGRIIGLDRVGESAPAGELFEHFGFSTENVVKVAKELL